jgi:hypothetical protein
VQTFGPSVPENTLVFGVCHLYASFNDTFVVSALAISRVARHTLLYRRHGTAKKKHTIFSTTCVGNKTHRIEKQTRKIGRYLIIHRRCSTSPISLAVKRWCVCLVREKNDFA